MLYKETLESLFMRFKATNINITMHVCLPSKYLNQFNVNNVDIYCSINDVNCGSYIGIMSKNKEFHKYNHYEKIANFLRDNKIPFNISNSFNKVYYQCYYENGHFKINARYVGYEKHNSIDLSDEDKRNIDIFKVMECT